jgi:uncharacterized protein YjeT (DUF2065 family)
LDVLIAALGLVLLLEGLAYALFPERMRDLMVQVLQTPPETLRTVGLAAAAIGLIILWLAVAPA